VFVFPGGGFSHGRVWQKGRVFYRWAFAGRSLGVRWAFAGRSLVVSNNQDYEAGQSFTLTSGSGSAHVKIQAVKDGKLMLENRGKTGVITMKKS